jgi:CubicO group peptidase (beta-lactamase class C family)
VRYRRFTLIALVVFSPPALDARQDKTEIFIKAEMQRQNIPGLSLVVLKDGRIVKAAGYGVENVDLKTPASPDTVYKIASVSKQFIASGIMLLVQDGTVALNDPNPQVPSAFTE